MRNRRNLTRKFLAVVLAATLFVSSIGADIVYFADTMPAESSTETTTEVVINDSEEVSTEIGSEESSTESIPEEQATEVVTSEENTESTEVSSEISSEDVAVVGQDSTEVSTESSSEDAAEETVEDDTEEENTGKEEVITVYKGKPYSFNYYESVILSTSMEPSALNVNVYKVDKDYVFESENDLIPEKLVTDTMDDKAIEFVKVIYYLYNSDGYSQHSYDVIDEFFTEQGAAVESLTNKMALSEQVLQESYKKCFDGKDMNEVADSYMTKISGLVSPPANFNPVLLKTKEGKIVAVSFEPGESSLPKEDTTEENTEESSSEELPEDGLDSEDSGLIPDEIEEEEELEVVSEASHSSGDKETFDVTSYTGKHVAYTKYKNYYWSNKKKGYKSISDALNDKDMRGTSYSSIQCAQYASRALKKAGLLDKEYPHCFNLYNALASDTTNWKQSTKIWVGDVTWSSKKWKGKTVKELSKKANDKFLSLYKSGKIKAGDVVLFVKSDLVGNDKKQLWGHAAIVRSCRIKDQNGDETVLIDHATSSATSFFTGKNGRGPLSSSLMVRSENLGVVSASMLSQEALDAYIEEEGGAGIGFVVFTPKTTPSSGNFKIQKTSSNTLTVTAENYSDNYNFDSIEFNVYKTYKDGKLSDKVGTVTLDDSGYGTLNLSVTQETKFYIQEVSASVADSGYKAATAVHTIKVTPDDKGNLSFSRKNADGTFSAFTTFNVANTPNTYSASIHKVSGAPELTNGNSNYSLAGAQYQIYNQMDDTLAVWYPTQADAEKGTNGSSGVLTTDANGNTPTVYMLAGEYYVVETKASTGYKLHSCSNDYVTGSREHLFSLSSSQTTATVVCEEPVEVDPIEISVKKQDNNTKVSLEGAIFEVAYYNQILTKEQTKSATPTRRWYLKTGTNGETKFETGPYATAQDGYTSDAFYMDSDENKGFPAGTVTVKEVKAPVGYSVDTQEMTLNGTVLSESDFIHGTITVDASGNLTNSLHPAGTSIGAVITASDNPLRGDIQFKKIDYETGKGMEGIPFKITNKKTKESHIVVTDKDGNYSSSSSVIKHTTNTNGNDDFETDKVAEVAGLWFVDEGKTFNQADVDDSVGALPAGEYTIEELSCDANKGKQLIIPIDFTVVGDSNPSTVKMNDIGTIANVPEMSIPVSLASNPNNGSSFVFANGTGKVSDVVTYRYLTAGKTYTLKGILMKVEIDADGNRTATPLKDLNGEYVRGNHTFTLDSSYTTTPQEKCGEETVNFEFSTTELEGTTIVCYEYLYEGASDELISVSEDGEIDSSGAIMNDEGEAIKHADVNDLNQTVYIPSIKTNAWTTNTGMSTVSAFEDVEIVDTVNYEGLQPGLTYMLKATVMYLPEGATEPEPFKVNDQPVTAEITFVAESSSGSQDVTLPKFVASELDGKFVVMYEELYLGDVLIAEEKTFDNVDQTIYFTKLETVAVDSKTLDHWSLADGEITIIDKVLYSGLTVGKEFTVSGTLMDKDTGKPLLDANGVAITSSTTFTPTEPSGYVNVIFTFSGEHLKGTGTVAFEELTYNGKTIATHADINDEGQTVYFPKLFTTLREQTTQLQSSALLDNMTLVDEVYYENVKVGATYRVEGYLVNKVTGQPIEVDGVRVTGSTEFVATATSGIVAVTYNFDATRAGLEFEGGEKADIVCYETLLVAQDFAEQGHYEEVYREGYYETVYEHVLTCVNCGVVISELSDEEFKEHVLQHGEYKEELVEGTPIYHEGTYETQYVVDVKGETKDVVVALDENINNISQTILVPSGKTTALDSETMSHTAYPDEQVTINDTIEYKGLSVGTTYTVKGQLYVKPDEENAEAQPLMVNGQPVTSETTFKAEAVNGTVVVSFTFDASSLAGKSVVVFEDCYVNDVLVFTHSDIEDEGQTIHFPEIGTTATSEKGKKTLALKDEVTLVDTISYKNLTPGETYIAYGTVMDKETGEPLKVGNKKVKASTEFTPKSADGTIEVKFTFSTKGLAGKDLVVFEDVRTKELDISIAVHEDIEDEGQTVTVKKGPSIVETGDSGWIIFFATVIIGCIIGIIVFIRRRQRPMSIKAK